MIMMSTLRNSVAAAKGSTSMSFFFKLQLLSQLLPRESSSEMPYYISLYKMKTIISNKINKLKAAGWPYHTDFKEIGF